MDYQAHTLSNGIRLISVPSRSNISHACFLIYAGSRDEKPEKSGLAHFIEHLIFKRTTKRNTNQILNRLELVGADLNAYTTKEYTCIHASFLNPYLDRTLDLFEDLIFHSIFPEDEMAKETDIILDEIASYQDQPDEAINDDFEDMLFDGHPLGKNILGTPESVGSFKQADIFDFIKSHYRTDHMVLGVSGNYDHKKLIYKAEKFFAKAPKSNDTTAHKETNTNPYIPQKRTITKPINQTHGVIGTRSYSVYSPHKIGLSLLNNLLGGAGMSSRLNLELREKHGIAYNIESNYTPFSDTGIFSIYFGTDVEKTEKALYLIHRELKKLRDKPLSHIQLHQAKQKFTGQIALAEENRLNVLLSMSKSILDYNRVDSLEEIFNQVYAVTASQLLEIADETFNPSKLSVLLFKPSEPHSLVL